MVPLSVLNTVQDGWISFTSHSPLDKLPPVLPLLCSVTIIRLMGRVDFGSEELIVSHIPPMPHTDETIRAVNLVVIHVNMSADGN